MQSSPEKYWSYQKILTHEACQTAVQTLIISRLDYCCSLLSNITGKQLHKLQVIQNRAARLITLSHPRDHIKPVLAALHWLPVHLRIQFRILVYTYKCLSGLAPGYLTSMLTPYRPSRTLRSANDPTRLVCPSTKKSIGMSGFTYVAPHLWNDVPQHIREYPTVHSFKRQLKAFYYTDYFNS